MYLQRCLFYLAAFLIAAAPIQADEPTAFDVWPGKVPGEAADLGPEKFLDQKPDEKRPVKRLGNVSRPTLTVFRPTKNVNGAAVVICPGGGYNILAWDLEGTEVAQWLNSIGVTGIVLKYRVPRRPMDAKDKPPPGALQDAQRAISVVRSKATELGIDPKRIGILGFSAGGHLAAAASTNFDKRSYEPIDAVDAVSSRPDFTVLIYPAYLTMKGTTELNGDIHVSKATPPTFFVHASNDPISAENSVGMYLALKRSGVAAELHLYATGGHGFGLRPSDHPCCRWPDRCADWLRSQGMLTPNVKQ
jgi:acetyl esterase/lipase